MGFWMIGVWLVFVVIAFLVYEDAEKRGPNNYRPGIKEKQQYSQSMGNKAIRRS